MNDRSIQRFPLPIVVDPPETICFQINVPNDPYHIDAFYGALWALTMSRNWARDDAHTAAEVSRVWSRIFFALVRDSCKVPTLRGTAGADGGDEQLIRQNPDNPCELQTSIDGITWCTFADLSLCLPPPPQPGAGAEQPQPGGGCALYHGTMGAQTPWYVPTVVSTGDTIQLIDPAGAWTDGGSNWYCPDGGVFFAGACTGLFSTSGSDPLPSAHHMALIAKIGSVYYDVSDGTAFTVPSGHSNDQITLLANDDDPSNNAGTITFDVQVCNNQAATWTSIINFETNPFPAIFPVSPGHWSAGQGYIGDPAGGDNFVLVMQLALDSCTIDSWDTLYNAGGGAGPDDAIITALNGSPYGTPIVLPTGTDLHYITIATVTGVTAMAQSLNSGSGTNNFAVRQWTIKGHGTKPSQLP